jgi:hypothetical protein
VNQWVTVGSSGRADSRFDIFFGMPDKIPWYLPNEGSDQMPVELWAHFSQCSWVRDDKKFSDVSGQNRAV